MKAMMYISRAVHQGSAAGMPHDCAALTKVSRANNTKNDVSGFLSYQDGYFLQYVEGPSSKVDRLFIKIANDIKTFSY
ncbi:MAG: hypothetical protein ACJAQ6_001868 [Arenicella sp.]|jgi:hypothetical protein